MKTAVRIAGLLFISVLIGSCGSTFKDYIKLGDIRVLAIVADKPETSAGQVVQITPYLSDINGSGRSLFYSAAGCLDPGIAYGASPSCDSSATLQTLATNTAITGLTSPNYTGFVNSFNVTIPATSVVFALRTTVEKFNGIGYLVTYKISDATGTTLLSSYKRIVVSNQSTPKANPVTSAVKTADGTSLTALPVTSAVLTPSFSTDSTAQYQGMAADGTVSLLDITLTTTWFISDGSMSRFRTNGVESNTFTSPTPAPSTRNTLIITVTHNGRGGIAVQEFRL
jgi:hypothetical protein